MSAPKRQNQEDSVGDLMDLQIKFLFSTDHAGEKAIMDFVKRPIICCLR